MTENETFIYESIFNQVRMGFLPLEEIKDNILDEIEDNGFEEEITEGWAVEVIENEYAKLIDESKQWKKPTDTEKLIKAFDELCKHNIIALHNAGFTTRDGEVEVAEVERDLRTENIISEGYCFYHEQDLQRAVMLKDSGLYLAFQKVDNSDDSVTVAVGKKVVSILKENGFEVEWNETPTAKILIPNFKWQLVYNDRNRDLQDYNDTVDLMVKNINKSVNLKEQKNQKKISWWKKLWS